MWEFVEQWFINPIYTGEGYNIFNTIVYVLLFVAGMYAVKYGLKKWKLNTDKKLFYALLPYFIFAGLLRALQDYSPVKHWLFITPGIYLLMIVLLLGILFFSKKDLRLTKKIGWSLVAAGAGLVLSAAYVSDFNLQWLMVIVGVTVFITVVLTKLFPKILKTRENRIAALAQVLDGTASAIPIAFLGYFEQHVVSGLIIGANPFLFLGLKLALVVGALHYIDKKKSDWNWLLKIAIVLLGLAPGIRDLARVLIGV